jgi:hypothetical protein
MHGALLLPFRFDPVRLKSDLARVREEEWTPHFNERDYGGDWRGVALRSQNGDKSFLFASFVGAAEFRDTELMDRCAYFRELLSVFECPVKAVRLLSLGAGSFVREHRDHALSYEDGEMRIHIPVQTSGEVEFYVDGERLPLEEGRTYYINVNLPHRIVNGSDVDRVHLVLDIEVNEWVHELVRAGVNKKGRELSPGP